MQQKAVRDPNQIFIQISDFIIRITGGIPFTYKQVAGCTYLFYETDLLNSKTVSLLQFNLK